MNFISPPFRWSAEYRQYRLGKRSIFHGAFSMIELLVAMAIIITIVGIAVPVFKGGGDAWGLDVSGNHVAGLLNSARQNSIAKNAITAVILLTDSQLENHHRIFGVYELLPQADGSAPAKSDWHQIGKWEVLSTGVIVGNCTFPSYSTQPTPAFPSIKYGGKTVSEFQYLIYFPGGGNNSDTTTVIRLNQGHFPPGSSSPVYKQKNSSGTSGNYYNISIINSIGTLKIDRP